MRLQVELELARQQINCHPMPIYNHQMSIFFKNPLENGFAKNT
jgi:hypothetical protein